GVVMSDAINHGHIMVGVSLGVVVVETINMDTDIDVVGGPAAGNAHIAKTGLTLVRRPPAHGDAVLTEAAGVHVFNSDIRQTFSTGQTIVHVHSAAAVAAFSFDNQVSDYHSARVLAGNSRPVTGANRRPARSVRANGDRRGGRRISAHFHHQVAGKAVTAVEKQTVTGKQRLLIGSADRLPGPLRTLAVTHVAACRAHVVIGGNERSSPKRLQGRETKAGGY